MPERRLLGLRLAAPAARDLHRLLNRSERKFGLPARLRYEALIRQALNDLRENPERLGVDARPDLLMAAARVYHLRHSRDRVQGARVHRPRHFILYRVTNDTVEVARILHDSFDLQRHIPPGLRT